MTSTVPVTTLVEAEDGNPISVSIQKVADGVVLIHFGHSFTSRVTESNLSELRYIVEMVAVELYGSANPPEREDEEFRG